MKILTSNPPHQYKAGNLLDPNAVNENLSYLADATADAASKRFAHSVVVYPFQEHVSSGYQDGYTQERRSYRVTAVETLWIERAYLDGALSAGSADIYIYDESTGAAPPNVTNPILSATTTEATDFFGQEIQIPAGSTYRFEIVGGSFTVSKLDLIVHYRTDRFNTAGSDTLQTPAVSFFTEGDAIDATAFAAAHSAIDTAVSANVAKTSARKVMLFVAHNFVTGTDADLRRWELPRVNSATGRCKVVGLNAFALFGSGSSAGITWAVLTQSGGSTGVSTTVSMGGGTFATNSTASTVDLHTASAEIEQNASLDYRITVTSNTSTNCLKSYCYVWIE